MEARVAAGVVLLVGLSLGAVLVVASGVLTRSAIARASSDLEAARSAFYKLIDSRAETAVAQTRLITNLPVFRATMTDVRVAADVETVTRMADQYREQLGAEFTIVTDRTGNAIGTPGWPADVTLPPSVRADIVEAVAGRPRRQVITLQDRLFIIVSEPATFADEVIGTMTVGFLLDDGFARDVAQVAHTDVSLVSHDRLAGSSLPALQQAELQKTLASGTLRALRGVSPEVTSVAARRYVAGVFPLLPSEPSDAASQLVLMQDFAPTEQSLDELRDSLLVAGAATFIFALTAGIIFSHRTTRPLMDMAAAAGEIADGNWSRQVPVRGGTEAATTAMAFNDMTTHLRHYYEEAKDKSERLQASYQRFSSVTQSARDAIISADQQGRITFWNRSAETIFGYAEAEALGLALVGLIAEPDRAAYLGALPADLGGSGMTFGRTIEVTALRKDGTAFPVECSLASWRDGTGASLTVVVRDETERRNAQEVLRQREEQLFQSQKMEAIGRLAGGVAHDFNNLLMVIYGYCGMLMQGLAGNDEHRRDVEEILKAAERAAGLTRQLLAFSRRQVIMPRVIALDELVAGTEKMLHRLIGEDIELETESEPGLGCVLADANQIEQILVNLVVNARDAMPTGGKLSIGLKNLDLDAVGAVGRAALPAGRYIALSVADTGSGMDEGIMSRIFEPFFTTKETGRGTGLGLATVYGIVQQSGGAVDVASELGQGTTFTVYLPRVEEAATPEQRQPAAVVGGQETVLLVEDDERVRAVIAGVLKQYGYTALIASQGDQALEIAAQHKGPIHLLVTDVVMPQMSGRVLAERLTIGRRDTRVLFMSGHSDDAVLRHGVRAAATHYIQKPFSAEALARKIRETLDAPADLAAGNQAGRNKPRDA